jgi:organic radical activating enzyme
MNIVTLLADYKLEDAIANTDTIFEHFKSSFANRNLIIYGASVIGISVYRAVCELGIKTEYIVDQDADKLGNIDGFAISKPDLLPDLNNACIVFIAASVVTTRSILSNLPTLPENSVVVTNGEHAANLLQCAVCAKRNREGRDCELVECGICSVLDNHCPVFRKRGEDVIGALPYSEKRKSKTNTMIGYVLGKVCSLNCKHCCESIPLYPKERRKFMDAKTVIKDIEQLASACEHITKVELIGGEPFLHPHLASIIARTLSIKNVAFVQVFTNGTIVPSKDLCNVLANKRVAVHISDYSHILTDEQKAKIERTKETLSQSKVPFVMGTGKKWFDFSSFDFRDDDETKLRERYNACFLHWCNRLCEGVLYVCPHHYAGTGLGYIDKQNDTVHIHELDEDELVDAIDRFKTLEFSEACRHCKMPWDAPVIFGAEQE